jgi:hypothetical protein
VISGALLAIGPFIYPAMLVIVWASLLLGAKFIYLGVRRSGWRRYAALAAAVPTLTPACLFCIATYNGGI